ncbi:unnamed protein product [Peniophora sp. CBMAI 1063]|nr:unnamed protein product [Peniophora sp. CBMAI 1063]
MCNLIVCCNLILAYALPSAAQSQLFRPAAIPIAAHSPYLLNYLPTNRSGPSFTVFQEGYSAQVQAWVGLIRVDGTTYAWAGEIDAISPYVQATVPTGPQQTLSPTSTVFTYQAGPVQVTVTFLNPIEPDDLVKQSIPASYLSLDALATDGRSHSIQVYTDITAEWASGDRSQNVTWSTTTTDDVMYHSISTINQMPYREVLAQSAWGTVYYATQKTPGTTYRTGDYSSTRIQFVQNGTLDNTEDTAFRSIIDSYPVVAFARDLGNVSKATSPIVWTVANICDSNSTGALTYTDLSGQVQARSLYYRDHYTDDRALLVDFLSDFPAAYKRSQSLDEKITQAAVVAGGVNYADILSLATRQAYCGIDITLGRNANGSVNVSDVMAFYKDTGFHDSGNGNAPVSPIDGLLNIFPAFLYLDPVLCGALLEPLLRFQTNSSYTNGYAALNLGPQYPSAVASTESHSQSIETSSGMIIMACAHAKATGDHSIIERYSALLNKWADYLGLNTLNASAQISNEGVTRSDETDLALKGIVAIQAMADVSLALNDSASGEAYSSKARTLYSQWATKALASDGHLRFSYDEPDSSFSLGQSMFWDLLLGTRLLNTTVIDAQTRYIAGKVQTYGAPTDSTNTSIASANLNMLAAAIATRDNNTKLALIGAVHNWANIQFTSTATIGQFPLTYDAQTGSVITGNSSPRQGAAYALLLVNASSFISGTDSGAAHPTEVGKSRFGTSVGVIVGATIGAVAGVCLLVGLLHIVRRRRSASTSGSVARWDNEPVREAVMRQASSVPHPLDIAPFVETDPTWHPLSSSVSDSNPSVDQMEREPEAGTKRAFRLRRLLHEEHLQQSASTNANPPPSATLAPQDQGDAGVLHEIDNIWREIGALRSSGAMSAPPEYNA